MTPEEIARKLRELALRLTKGETTCTVLTWTTPQSNRQTLYLELLNPVKTPDEAS